MATFYLLPPRPLLGERFAVYLKDVFPGLDWTRTDLNGLADLLGSAVGQHPDVFVVHREELADGEDVRSALQNGYGAEAGDEVVEVRAGGQPGALTAKRWRLEAAERSPAARS